MEARIPVPDWARHYERGWLRGDLLAGVTVTAYLIPQVMAYAQLAGLPAVAGLWASVGALLGYALLGSSRQLSVGPESTTALMTAAALGSVPGALADPGAFAAALALAVALFCLLGRLGHLAALSDLLSRPVLVGYLAGMAAIMVSSQLGKLLGFAVVGDGFLQEVSFTVHHLGDTRVPALLLGGLTLVAMLVSSAVWPRAPVALAGILAATAAAALLDLEAHGVRLVGTIAVGVPHPGLPAISAGDVTGLLLPALGVAFVGFTDNILTARGFAARHQQAIDPQREMLALGAANLGSALLHGFPVSSSGSRTAIADAVGGRSQLTSVVTVVCTVLALVTAGPVLAAFPLPALGAVVVYAAVRLVDVRELVRFARFRRSELVLALATTLAVLVVGVLDGILVAIALSVLDLLHRVARPHDAVEGYAPGVAGMHDVADYPDARRVPGLLVYRYDSPLFFANAEDFHRRALAAVDANETPVEWFVLNTEAIVEVDITAVDVLENLRAELERRGIVMALARVKQDLRGDLLPTGLLDRIGEDHVFPTLPTAVAAFEAWRDDRRPDAG
ncbi:SulP family sulfate permease [Nocardioides ginsengisegetis]|uniref:SulP family sulfate permease n=1 Tax=Nocardioides ginsengisegetis TaxID=661491 RepID=A0A7W3P9H7_9ACTN|nr:sulfate permease [Nocardioides ginsengisegetis]MBA8803442.1 SulP family sulfate permease [Nocardioides ginsengisegetis]